MITFGYDAKITVNGTCTVEQLLALLAECPPDSDVKVMESYKPDTWTIHLHYEAARPFAPPARVND